MQQGPRSRLAGEAGPFRSLLEASVEVDEPLDRVLAPAEQVGTLPGTTAAVALARSPVPVDVRLGTVDELRAADEVMLLSSVRGVTPVVRLDGRELGTGPVTTAVRAAYERAVLEG